MSDLLEFITARLDAERDRLEALRAVALDAVLWAADNRCDGVHECLGIEQHGVKRWRRWWPDSAVTDWGHVMHSSAVELFSQAAVTRGLRDVAAKRRVLERHRPDVRFGECVTCLRRSDLDDEYGPAAWPCAEVLDMASVWSDHPSYDPSWSPI